MQTSESIDQVVTALAAALADPPSLIRSTEGQAGPRRYKYVELPQAIELLRPHLRDYGLFILQPALEPTDKGCVREQTVIIHAATAQWIADDGMQLPMGKADPQGAGSAVTYARRYGLLGLLGLAQEDDDGASAGRGASGDGREGGADTPRANSGADVPMAKAVRGRGEAGADVALAAPESVAAPSDESGRIAAAVMDITTAQQRDSAAASEYVSNQPDKRSALRSVLIDARRRNADGEVVANILTERGLAEFIEVFNAVDITD